MFTSVQAYFSIHHNHHKCTSITKEQTQSCTHLHVCSHISHISHNSHSSHHSHNPHISHNQVRDLLYRLNACNVLDTTLYACAILDVGGLLPIDPCVTGYRSILNLVIEYRNILIYRLMNA